MKVAVWGLGKHSINKIVPVLSDNKNLSLYGVCSRNKTTIDDVSEEYECKKWLCPETMLRDNKLDVVYLSTPAGLHYVHGQKVISSGKHLWCEKPITTNHKETISLIDQSIKADISVCEAFMYLYHPHFIRLKEIIHSNLLGKIKNIHCVFDLPTLDNPGYRNKKELGASSLFDLGVYPISIILSLFKSSNIEITNKEIKFEETNSYDIEGSLNLRINKEIECLLEWAYDKTYKNEILIEGTKSSLSTEYIFSKDSDYLPYFNIIEKNKTRSIIETEKANHFELMLNSFYLSSKDLSSSQLQKDFILDRSLFLKQILK